MVDVGKNSVAYRSSVLWNAILRHDSGTYVTTKYYRVGKIGIFRDFTFNMTSASMTKFREYDFIYT